MAGRFAWVMAVGAAALLGGCSLGRPVPGFTFSPEGGAAPLSVQFTNTSTGGGPFAVAWSWDFGDETPADSSESPAHVYAAAGDYSVTLTMKTWRGDRSTVGGPVSVVAAPDPVPVFAVDFSASPTAGAAPLVTQFANGTVFSGKCNAVWSWDFGDGSALSSEASPAHVYAVPGTYTVRLTARVGSVEQTKERAGYVVVTQTPEPGAGPVLERTVSPAAYTSGEAMAVTLRVLYSGTQDITALGIQETLPEGWTYSGVSGDGAPPVSPSSGATGTLSFAYLAVPSFPVEFSYAVLPPTVANGVGTFSGQVLYRTTGGEQVSQPCVTEVSPAGGGEGEGEGEPLLAGVPDLSGLSIEEVAGVLAESDLVLGGVSGVWSDTVELGRVVGQAPAPGTMVPLDSAVAVSISEVARATLLHLSRATAPAGVYVRGGQVRVEVTLDRVGAQPVAPLEVVETLPEGWSYGEWGDGPAPDSGPLAGDGGTLAFSWEETGAFPWTFSYTVNVPQDAAGSAVLSGKAVYDAGYGVLESNTETTPLWMEGGGGLVLDRTVGGTGVWIPGEALEVTLTVFTAGVFTGTLTSFGLEEVLPEGWVYDGVASASTMPAGAGVPEATNTLGIYWIAQPTLPLTVVYRVLPGGESPVACMQGQAIYFVGGGGQQRSNAEVTCVSEGLAP